MKARNVLKLKLSDGHITESWEHFGGTVLYTPTADDETIKPGKQNVTFSLQQLDTPNKIIDAFHGVGDTRQVIHRLFHFQEQVEHGTIPDLGPASVHIAVRLDRRLMCLFDQDRRTLLNWPEGSGKGSTL